MRLRRPVLAAVGLSITLACAACEAVFPAAPEADEVIEAIEDSRPRVFVTDLGASFAVEEGFTLASAGASTDEVPGGWALHPGPELIPIGLLMRPTRDRRAMASILVLYSTEMRTPCPALLAATMGFWQPEGPVDERREGELTIATFQRRFEERIYDNAAVYRGQQCLGLSINYPTGHRGEFESDARSILASIRLEN